jgi:hypothetical protein
MLSKLRIAALRTFRGARGAMFPAFDSGSRRMVRFRVLLARHKGGTD